MKPRLRRNTCSSDFLKTSLAGLATATVMMACGANSPMNTRDEQGAALSPPQATSNPMAVVAPESALPDTNSPTTSTPTTLVEIPLEENLPSAGDVQTDTGTGSESGTDTDTNTDTDTDTGTDTGAETATDTNSGTSTDSDTSDSSEGEQTDANTASFTTPASCSASSTIMMQRTLTLINEVRSVARSCGSVSFDVAGPLAWSAELESAARDHSLDMTQHNFFSHTGSDGSSIGTRVTATGYNWRTVGENIAAGQTTAAQTIDSWVSSPGHCSNLMNPAFTQVAVSCVEDSGADFKFYWTNVLAAPQ